MKSVTAFVFFTFAAVALAFVPGPQLGPVKSCRCFSHAPTHMQSMYGPAELCYCRSSVQRKASINHVTYGRRSHQGMRPVSFVRNMFRREDAPAECSTQGPDVEGTIIADDFVTYYMCGTELWKASLNDPQSYGYNKKDYTCGTMYFTLENNYLSTGLAFSFTANGQKYALVGSDSPALPDDTIGLTAYAAYAPPGWTSCYGVDPTTEAVYISDLDDEPAFKSLAAETGAYPIGVSNGFYSGLTCIKVENPTC